MRILLISIITILLSACAFHSRSASDIPPQLKLVHFSSDAPYSPFTTELKNMLNALHVTLTPKRQQAPYQIVLSDYTFTQNTPSLSNTVLATTFTYALSVKISIRTENGKRIIGPLTLSTSTSVVQNASQVYTPGSATLAKQWLRRDLITRIYYVLISENTKSALERHGKHT